MMFPAPDFTSRTESAYRAWCIMADNRLRELSGRPLADAPVGDAALRCWWSCDVPAHIVAQGLSTRVAPIATAKRFFTDNPAWLLRDRLAKVAV